MPVKTGIQVRFWLKFKTRLDSGVRRKNRKTVDFQSTTPESSAYSSGSLSRPYSILHLHVGSSKSPRPLRQGHPQGGVEKEVRTESQARGEDHRQRPAAFLHDFEEESEHEEHGETITETLDGKDSEDARRQYRQGVAPLGPAE
jgi:hypothetical protein